MHFVLILVLSKISKILKETFEIIKIKIYRKQLLYKKY